MSPPAKHRRASFMAIAFTLSVLNLCADANSWLKPTSGNWEEPQWSKGILPNYGHAVMITNAGWKAVQIAPSTAELFPDSLTVYSINIASPIDSFNTLLVNYAGFDHPLTINYSITVGSNAAMSILSSALRLNGPSGVGLSIGGEFNQDNNSQVYGNQADVGWVGPGVYNLNSGALKLDHLWVGGYHSGVFNQNGGSNSPGILHLEASAPFYPGRGTYNLRGGDFNGITYFSGSGLFVQDGGRVHSLIEINAPGTYPQYVLNNGINYGGVSVAGNPRYGGIAQALQNGGTNFGPIQVGGENFGYYTLSNGVVSSPIIKVIREGSFHQTGGIVTTASKLTVQSGPFSEGYVLIGGSLSSPGIDLALYSSFTQSGGTNNIAGDLSIVSSSDWRSHGYEITGGQLSVSNIVVSSYSTFTHSGGMVSQSGTLTLETSTFFAAPGNHQFGPLKLSGSNALVMPVTSSTLRFRNSSGLAWSSIASLIISNWSGSYLGDGRQRIIFGNSSSALTPQQLRQILFAYPANLAYGIYPAKILSTGEIVPDGLPPTGHNPSRVAVRESSPGYTMEISVTGDAGYDYGLLTSYDLVNWHLLTNHVATNGTFSVTDLQYQWPYYLRYYKAVLMR